MVFALADFTFNFMQKDWFKVWELTLDLGHGHQHVYIFWATRVVTQFKLEVAVFCKGFEFELRGPISCR